MDTILEIDSNFDFTKLSLGQPQPFQGGSFFTKITYNGNDLQIQFPKCKTKQGINQTEKKYFTDLLYDTVSASDLTSWLETLETTFQKLIFNKRDLWFHSQIELNDIESVFTNSARLYKSGKQFLIRCQINKTHNNKQNIVIYDEDEKLLGIQDVTCEKDIIPLLRVDGIKFSARSFQIEYNLTQIMVLNEYEEVSHCMIKHNKDNTGYTTVGGTNIPNHDLFNLQPPKKEQENYLGISKVNNGENVILDSNSNSNSNSNREDNNLIGANSTDNITLDNREKLDFGTGTEKEKEKEKEITLVNMNIQEQSPVKPVNDLEPVEISFNELKDEIKIRKPNEVYYEIYRAAREKAKLAKIAAIEAYLEAKSIKTKYMLDDLDESFEDDSSDFEELIE